MQKARYVSLPSTNLKVEVVLPIPFCGGVLKACSRRICVLLCESLKRLHDDNQTAQHEICAKMFYVHHCSLWFICLSRWLRHDPKRLAINTSRAVLCRQIRTVTSWSSA